MEMQIAGVTDFFPMISLNDD